MTGSEREAGLDVERLAAAIDACCAWHQQTGATSRNGCATAIARHYGSAAPTGASRDAPEPPSDGGLDAAELETFFREHGWIIDMDDRPGQAIWPFEVLAARLSEQQKPATTLEEGT